MLKSSVVSPVATCTHEGAAPGIRRALEDNRIKRERGAGMLRALADPQRLAIVELLSAGEMCVTEIAETVSAGASTVSERLRVLRTEGIVASRRDGKHIFYFLADHHITELVANLFWHAEEIDKGGIRQ
ncbi:MAG: ArsR/SmtB family transcription factor [Actinomycetota bacterium]